MAKTRIWLASGSPLPVIPKGMDPKLFTITISYRVVTPQSQLKFGRTPTGYITVEFGGGGAFGAAGYVHVWSTGSSDVFSMFDPRTVILIENAQSSEEQWNYFACKKCRAMTGIEDRKESRGLETVDVHIHCQSCNRGWVLEMNA